MIHDPRWGLGRGWGLGAVQLPHVMSHVGCVTPDQVAPPARRGAVALPQQHSWSLSGSAGHRESSQLIAESLQIAWVANSQPLPLPLRPCHGPWAIAIAPD